MRGSVAVAVVAWLAPITAVAQALPSMSEGYSVEAYASVPDPVKISVALDGTLYAGRDLSGSGGSSGAATRIHRVTPGDPPVVSEIGNPIDDPDAVFVDVEGLFAETPGDVLVGGGLAGVSPFAGYIASIEPSGTTTTLLPSNQTVQNPVGFGFDSHGTLWVASFDNRLLIPVTESGPGATTLLSDEPLDMIVEPGGDLLFVSLQNGTVQIWVDGLLIQPSLATGRALAIGPGTNGFGSDLYVVNPANGTLSRVDPGGGAVAIGTGFGNDGFGLAFGPDGRLYVSDFDNDRILVVPENTNATAALAAVAFLVWRRAISDRA